MNFCPIQDRRGRIQQFWRRGAGCSCGSYCIIYPPESSAAGPPGGAREFLSCRRVIHGADAPWLDSYDKHRNCLSNPCFNVWEAGIEPRDGHPGVRATTRPYRSTTDLMKGLCRSSFVSLADLNGIPVGHARRQFEAWNSIMMTEPAEIQCVLALGRLPQHRHPVRRPQPLHPDHRQ
ncbi:hypothetical protein CUJ84_Chr000526 [Rhizobium leguminosarum]|uniref:Uncharacterized protein n=1 Tax=Rhizobium leguminosarum TaxID=384 RepID=A0A2K9YY69_RHILE|nr:hypothetical protein CUJ84_Chr000526 [Rhizobium leguminosarum]